MTETLSGKIGRVTYHNAANGYSILKVYLDGTDQRATVIGTMINPRESMDIDCHGDWAIDPRYGRQFRATSITPSMPHTTKGIENYLRSGFIAGIGPTIAKRIVRHFGEKSIDIITHSPEKLKAVHGVGDSIIAKIRGSWSKQQELNNIMLFLKEYEISDTYAMKIYKTYGANAVQILRENPYKLADDIHGIGFKVADKIATQLGIEHDHPSRLRSGLLYILNQYAESGHVYYSRPELAKAGSEILDVPEELIQDTITMMDMNSSVILDATAVYLPMYYFAERGIAKRTASVLSTPRIKKCKGRISQAELKTRTRIDYDGSQLDAIYSSLDSKFMVLTGGPGTGKTTTTLGIIAALKHAGLSISLAAPTGRAAKRLSEVTSMPAKTIHRLLEFNPESGFARNDTNPLSCDVLLVDECSMVDTLLMNSLLKAVKPTTSVILVGDVDQLPSVGAGNVLKDFIDSGQVTVIRLENIFRQAQTSKIITNAHAVNKGKLPDITPSPGSDFVFVEREAKEDVQNTILTLFTKTLPESLRVHPNAIQIITPMTKGELGTKALNQQIQSIINPYGDALKWGEYMYRRGDKVMQTSNDYTKNVFNGDVGFITSVDTADKKLTVTFDNRAVEYTQAQLEDLVLAYAITIHKSQGSEFPYVIMPVHNTHYIMLQRNLLYTGITRTKKLCTVIGNQSALRYAVTNQPANGRYTKLKERLIMACK